jgi:hypothetical protein
MGFALDLSDYICYLCLVVTRGRPGNKPGTMGTGDGGPPSDRGPEAVHPGSAPRSPLGHTFAGWTTLGDMISSSNPKLSSAMRSLAAVLRAGIEHSTNQHFKEIRSILHDKRLPAFAMYHIEEFFLSDHLDATVGEIAELARHHLSDLMRHSTVNRTRPPNSAFLSSVMQYGRQAILGGDAQRLRPPWLSASQAEIAGHFLPATQLRVVASLELRKFASDAEFSIWCRKPLRWRGDRLIAEEHTYIQRDVCSLSNPRFKGRIVKEEYREDIDELFPADFVESIDIGRPVDQFYYSYELTGQRRSRSERRMRAILEKNGSEIHEVLQSIAESGTALAEAAATIHGVPIGLIRPLVRPFSRIAADGIKALLLRDIAITPWSITHTTLNMPEFPDGPLSMFTVISAAAPTAKLHRVRRHSSDPNVSTMDLRYTEKVRANQQGRGMIGVSKPPEQPCPGDLWGHVALKNQPAVWTEPGQDNGGFRILVPHAEIGRKTSYVSALRADVLRIQDGNLQKQSHLVADAVDTHGPGCSEIREIRRITLARLRADTLLCVYRLISARHLRSYLAAARRAVMRDPQAVGRSHSSCHGPNGWSAQPYIYTLPRLK